MTKTIIVGWDGATWDLLAPWAEAGLLPNVARLLAQGAHGPLQSTIQPLTAVAWSSFLTGSRPGKHGLYDFVGRVPGSYDVQLTGRAHRRTAGLWQYLSQAEKKIIAINVPMMVPVTPVNGILVGGIDAPGLSEQTVYPAGFIPELNRIAPNYRIAASERSLADWHDSLHAMVAGREKLTLHLRDNQAWDCLMVVFNATDIVQHIFWGHMAQGKQSFADTILSIYQACDRILGRLLDGLDDETTLILMSDHGAGPIKGAININRYLEEGGFLARRRTEDGGQKSSPMLRLVQLGKRWLPPQVRYVLRRQLGGLRDRMESQLVANAYDWSQTKVYSLGSYGNLFFNVTGREPNGLVHPDEIETLTSQLTQHLHALTDPETGQRLVKKVWRREELYEGAGLPSAPDLVIEWADYGYEVRTRFGSDSERVFSRTMPLNDFAPETLLAGTHRMAGILAAVGRGVVPGRVAHTHITDLAPTILHLLGQPVPTSMDGQVISQLVQGLGAVRFGDGLEGDEGVPAGLQDEEAAIIEERLRSLGYLS